VKAQALAVEVESAKATLTSGEESFRRMTAQLETAAQKSKDITSTLAELAAPMEGYDGELKTLLDRRLAVEERHSEARRRAETAAEGVQTLESQRGDCNDKVTKCREAVEGAKLAVAEFRVKAQGVDEQLKKSGFDRDSVLEGLEEGATTSAWEERLETLDRKIRRLEPVNLAAIQEYDEQAERLTYLDAQNADLEEALQTLENAIHKKLSRHKQAICPFRPIRLRNSEKLRCERTRTL
jgi:chromosome segregation protein